MLRAQVAYGASCPQATTLQLLHCGPSQSHNDSVLVSHKHLLLAVLLHKHAAWAICARCVCHIHPLVNILVSVLVCPRTLGDRCWLLPGNSTVCRNLNTGSRAQRKEQMHPAAVSVLASLIVTT
jgi:hypothetical protein